MVDLAPPYAVKEEFEAVQSAEIDAQTTIQKAKEYKATQTFRLPEPSGQKPFSKPRKRPQKSCLPPLLKPKFSFTPLLRRYSGTQRSAQSDSTVRDWKISCQMWTSLRFIPPPSGPRYPSDFRLQVEMIPDDGLLKRFAECPRGQACGSTVDVECHRCSHLGG